MEAEPEAAFAWTDLLSICRESAHLFSTSTGGGNTELDDLSHSLESLHAARTSHAATARAAKDDLAAYVRLHAAQKALTARPPGQLSAEEGRARLEEREGERVGMLKVVAEEEAKLGRVEQELREVREGLERAQADGRSTWVAQTGTEALKLKVYTGLGFTRVPGDTPALLIRHKNRVESVELAGEQSKGAEFGFVNRVWAV